jgi:hypothetical protein
VHVINLHLQVADRVDAAKVREWITTHGVDKRYIGNSNAPPFEQDWVRNVHAGKLLDDLFQDVSDAKLSFSKTRDDLLLVQWLLENRKEALEPLGEYLEELIEKCGASVVPAKQDAITP